MDTVLLREKDVTRVLSVGRSTIRKLMADGRLPYCHVGRALLFHVEDVKKLAQEIRDHADERPGSP